MSRLQLPMKSPLAILLPAMILGVLICYRLKADRWSVPAQTRQQHPQRPLRNRFYLSSQLRLQCKRLQLQMSTIRLHESHHRFQE